MYVQNNSLNPTKKHRKTALQKGIILVYWYYITYNNITHKEALKMIVENRLVPYYIVGSKEFKNKEEAERYENTLNELLKLTYYEVRVMPDLFEGKGYREKILIAIKGKTTNALLQYLLFDYGEPLTHMKTKAETPVDNWLISQAVTFDNIEEIQEYLTRDVQMGYSENIQLKVRRLFLVGDKAIGVEIKDFEDLSDDALRNLSDRV